MRKPKRDRMIGKHPRRILLQHPFHLTDDFQPFRRILHVFHLFKQPIVFGVVIVRGIFAAEFGPTVWPIEEEHEVLCIGVVRVPSPRNNLEVRVLHLVAKPVVIGGAVFHRDAELLKPAAHPRQARCRTGGCPRVIKIDNERIAVFVESIGITGFCEELTRFL